MVKQPGSGEREKEGSLFASESQCLLKITNVCFTMGCELLGCSQPLFGNIFWNVSFMKVFICLGFMILYFFQLVTYSLATVLLTFIVMGSAHNQTFISNYILKHGENLTPESCIKTGSHTLCIQLTVALGFNF